MGFAFRGEIVTGAMSLDELKLVYRALHKSLPKYPELMETDFLTELQGLLHQRAVEEGVDATDHGQWDAWLAGSSEHVKS